MILVIDSSALITLAKVGQLDLLRQLAETVMIPSAFYDEVVHSGRGRAGSDEVSRSEWIRVRQVVNREGASRLRGQIGRGEAESIVLAQEIQADLLILDDAVARRLAEEHGLPVAGLLGLLAYAKERGKISALRPMLDAIRAAGFYLDDRLYESLLRHTGEGP